MEPWRRKKGRLLALLYAQWSVAIELPGKTFTDAWLFPCASTLNYGGVSAAAVQAKSAAGKKKMINTAQAHDREEMNGEVYRRAVRTAVPCEPDSAWTMPATPRDGELKTINANLTEEEADVIENLRKNKD